MKVSDVIKPIPFMSVVYLAYWMDKKFQLAGTFIGSAIGLFFLMGLLIVLNQYSIIHQLEKLNESKKAKQKGGKITALGLVNFLVLQWFFIRLVRCSKSEVIVNRFNPVSNIEDATKYYYEWYSIEYAVIPLSGWLGSYWYIGKRSLKALTRPVRKSVK